VGVPEKLNAKWMSALEKAKGTSKMKQIKNRTAFVPYDDAIGFTPKMKEYSDDVYLVDAELIHFNQHSGRLGAWGQTVGAKLDQNKKTDFEKIRMRNIVNPQITLNESKEFQKRLRNETQQIVAIAQADGVLIDGNRRFANLLQIGVKKLYVYILPEYVHPDDLEEIEGFFSFASDTRVRYTEYLRGIQITKKIRKIMPKGSLPESDFIKEAKKALTKIEDDFLKSINMSVADGLKLVQAVFEGEQWCKANDFVTGGKGDTDVLEDKTKTGKTTPGFEVFLRSVGMINKAQGRTEPEKMKEKMIVRKMVWSAVNPKISGRAADRVDKIKIVMNNAKVKKHVFSNAQVVTGSSWKKPSSWDDLEKQIAVGKVAGKSNASVAKVKNSHKSLESVKISEIKSSHRKELNPLVKEMKDKLKKITDKISQ
jgi:hypothetical protein